MGCAVGTMSLGIYAMFGVANWYGTSLISSGASGSGVMFVSITLLWCPHYFYHLSTGICRPPLILDSFKSALKTH